MMTVKEISELTGISVRTLHYYDEIGLFTPTGKSEAGYRLYDDKALETLQQILFFREFGIPLKEIKAVMDNPDLDRDQILQMQRKMLETKKKRIERLISSIDDILKGDTKMDFTVFDETDIRTIYTDMVNNMNDEQKQIFIDRYGSMDAFEEHFLKSAASEQAQKNFAKVVEWYGSKEATIEASKNPGRAEKFPECQRRMDAVTRALIDKKGRDVHSAEIQLLMREYDLIYRELFGMEDVTKLLLETAHHYQTNTELQKATDSVWGSGAAEYLGKAIEAFYRKK
ncbi:MAG: MerR family transcriptional regulator [Lachnospiraceae bacterium]|nr:MerR family transcriptional regulator [Lachnospiraceae bacterium]